MIIDWLRKNIIIAVVTGVAVVGIAAGVVIGVSHAGSDDETAGEMSAMQADIQVLMPDEAADGNIAGTDDGGASEGTDAGWDTDISDGASGDELELMKEDTDSSETATETKPAINNTVINPIVEGTTAVVNNNTVTVTGSSPSSSGSSSSSSSGSSGADDSSSDSEVIAPESTEETAATATYDASEGRTYETERIPVN